MNYKFKLLLSLLVVIISCKKEGIYLQKIEGNQINISDSLATDKNINAIIKPYREHLNTNLDSILAYAVKTYSKKDGEYNTAIGNMMADAVYKASNPIFRNRTGEDIDFVVLNHGGIRSIISKGYVSKRTAFQIMPFENSVVVVKLKGLQIKALIDYLVKAQRAHPIAELQLVLNADNTLNSASINAISIDFSKTYNVATNDYLYNGGDRMDFFKTNDGLYVLDYKIRNILIDHFTKIDTLNPVIDNRFIKLKN